MIDTATLPLPLPDLEHDDALLRAYRLSGLRRRGVVYEDALTSAIYGPCLRNWARAIELRRFRAQAHAPSRHDAHPCNETRRA